MTKRKHPDREVIDTPNEEESVEGRGGKDGPVGHDGRDGQGTQLGSEIAETAQQHPAVAELEELRDRHLRLAAEYDNYRKRILRERDEVRARVQADLMRMMLDAIDDLGRVTELDPAQAGAQDVIAGVELVERKLMKQLEAAGLTRIGEVGDVFDPKEHEAVGTDAAANAAQDGTVSMVMQPGYRLGTLLVRPARVRVYLVAETDHERADT